MDMFILIVFNISINIKNEIFKKIFLSTFSKRDSRQEREMSDLVHNFPTIQKYH